MMPHRPRTRLTLPAVARRRLSEGLGLPARSSAPGARKRMHEARSLGWALGAREGRPAGRAGGFLWRRSRAAARQWWTDGGALERCQRRALRRALMRRSWEASYPKRVVKLTSRDVSARRVDCLARCCLAGLTFELTPTAEARLVRPGSDDGTAGAARPYKACRSGSGVERVVRLHLSSSGFAMVSAAWARIRTYHGAASSRVLKSERRFRDESRTVCSSAT